MSQELKARLEAELKERGWTAAEAGRQLGVDRKTIIALIERPERAYAVRTVRRLEAGLGIKPGTLLAIAGESRSDAMLRTKRQKDPDFDTHEAERIHAARRQHPEWTRKVVSSRGYRESRHRSAVAAGMANRDAHTPADLAPDAKRPYFVGLGNRRWDREVSRRGGRAAAKRAFLEIRRPGGNPGPRQPAFAAVLRDRMLNPQTRLLSEIGKLWKTEVKKADLIAGRNPYGSLRRLMHGKTSPAPKGGRPRRESLPADANDLLALVATVQSSVDRRGQTLATIGRAQGWACYLDRHGNERCPLAGMVRRLGHALDRVEAGSPLGIAWHYSKNPSSATQKTPDALS